MKKGIYAIVKPKETGEVDINLLFCNNLYLYTVHQAQDKSMMGSVTKQVQKYKVDPDKYHFVSLNNGTYLDSISDISSREEFIKTLGVLASASKAANVNLYAYNSGEIVYTTDESISLHRDESKVVDFGTLNKKAMEALIRSEVRRFK
jgi:hypothetical protein